MIAGWSKHNKTFWDDHDPGHGNRRYATAEEFASELMRWLDDGDDGAVYDGPELTKDSISAGLHALLMQQGLGLAHGVSQIRNGEWRASGPQQGESLVLWRVVAAGAARRVAAKSKPEQSTSEQQLRGVLSRCGVGAESGLPRRMMGSP